MAEQSDPRAHREALQRVQVGVIGLGAVLLVVALANIVVSSVRTNAGQIEQSAAAPGTVMDSATNATTAPETEPFADLGVTPKAAPTAQVAPAVPDLEPDPRLSKPMDQDPKTAPQRKN